MGTSFLVWPSVETGAVCLLTILILSSRALALVHEKNNNITQLNVRQAYQCKDGTASEESEARYRSTIRVCSIVVLVASLIAFGVALTDAISQVSNFEEISARKVVIDVWLRVVSWTCIVLIGVCITLRQPPEERYRGGLWGALSVFLVMLLSVGHTISLYVHNSTGFKPSVIVYTQVAVNSNLILSIMEPLLGVVALITFLSFPRRPDVYDDNGLALDPEYTVSAVQRYTFQWVAPLLDLAARKETLDAVDLPRLSHATRAQTLHRLFPFSFHSSPLWRRILSKHLRAFLLQWTLTLLQSGLQFVPQLSMYNLLRQLELRQIGNSTTSVQVIWCAALGLGLLLNEWVSHQLYWMMFAQLGTPIRVQLSALIFGKALRRKNVTGPRLASTAPKNSAVSSNNTDEDSSPPTPQGADEEAPKTAAGVTVADDADAIAAAKKFSKSTINLLGVDAGRVADFCCMNSFVVASVLKVCISSVFLTYLVGWLALLAGVCSFALITPLTTVITKRYGVAQKVLMTVRDERLSIITDVLTGIRGIKFAALEELWEARIGAVRARELSVVWRIFVTTAMLELVGLVGPLLLSSVSLAVYVYTHGQLNPSVAFTTLAVFSSLEATIGLIPLLITDFIDSKVSASRIHDYLEAPERGHTISYAEEISMKGATLAWPSDSDSNENNGHFMLKDMNVDFPRGELTVILGKTGSGKSLLLAALIGESDLLGGTITMPRTLNWHDRYNHAATPDTWIVPGSLAVVPQVPWMENMSIKENILFGLPMEKIRYQETLSACSLAHDLTEQPDGDETEIGANGVNLSGGQRWRVALARALYSRAEILIFDDVFSAVDAHVGAWILEHALLGQLTHGRTRILATHQVALVAMKASYHVILANGTIKSASPVAPDLIDFDTKSNRRRVKTTGHNNASKENTGKDEPLIPKAGNGSSQSEPIKPKTAMAFVQEEKRQSGTVEARVFWTYFKASGGRAAWSFCLFAFLAAQVIVLGRSWWVKIWTASYASNSIANLLFVASSTNHLMASNSTAEQVLSQHQESSTYYLLIYLALGIVVCIAKTLSELYISALTLEGSRILFADMLHTVLRTPLRWIDTVPTGRILNRFTADFVAVDSRMQHDLGSMLSSSAQVLVIVGAGMVVSPVIVVLGIVLVAIAVRIAKRYLNAARGVKRLDSVAKSPVFEQFGSALVGLSTIRAFGNAPDYVERMNCLIDGYTMTSWYLWLLNRWLGFYMGLIGVVATVTVAVVIVSLTSIDAALAGFALSFTLEFSSALNWVLRRYANTELVMNAAERVHEYTELVTEKETGIEVPASWPSKGQVVIRDLVAAYDDDLPPVLKGVNFEVGANQRIGVVGRTGAGKSSLMLAIFRFLEAQSGTISIDGIDIAKIKLHDLRSRLSIIPQDPGLFAGTIRSNLDPLECSSDIQLHEALRRAHLTENPTVPSDQGTIKSQISSPANVNIFKDLLSPISDGGLNLSQGQRQLLCLARAILSQPKIMVLDEATSAVDMQTDVLIQRMLREEFANTTLIVIAHRLSTVADFDKIVVMSDGSVQESGTPEELMGRKGAFWRMIQESGGERGEDGGKSS